MKMLNFVGSTLLMACLLASPGEEPGTSDSGGRHRLKAGGSSVVVGAGGDKVALAGEVPSGASDRGGFKIAEGGAFAGGGGRRGETPRGGGMDSGGVHDAYFLRTRAEI